MFSTRRVAELSGASYRQLDYWARIGALRPEVEANGSGSRRRYTVRQVALARCAVLLFGMGAQSTPALWALRQLAIAPWTGAVVVRPFTGDVVAVEDVDGPGHGWLLDLPAIEAEMAASLLQGDALEPVA